MGLERTRAFAAEPLDHPNETGPVRTSSRTWPREERLAQCLFNARHRLCLAGGAIARPICLRGKRVWQEHPAYRIAAGGALMPVPGSPLVSLFCRIEQLRLAS
jgi:hypothetical protein